MTESEMFEMIMEHISNWEQQDCVSFIREHLLQKMGYFELDGLMNQLGIEK